MADLLADSADLRGLTGGFAGGLCGGFLLEWWILGRIYASDCSNGLYDLKSSPQEIHQTPPLLWRDLQDCRGQVGTHTSSGPMPSSALACYL